MGNQIISCVSNFKKPRPVDLLDLPNEIILHIFSFISKEELFWTIGLTCKKFYSISCEFNGNKIEVSDNINDYKVSLNKISKYLEVLHSITHLVIWWYPEDYIGLHESLDNNFTKFTRYKKGTCVEKNPLLRFSSGVILIFKTDSGKRFVESRAARHGDNLFNIFTLAKKCSNLEGLYWKDTQSYGNFHSSRLINRSLRFYPSVDEIDVIALVKTAKHLKYLTLCNFHGSDIDYTKLIQNCYKLHTLDLTLSYNVENEALYCISAYCCELKYIDLTLCSKITDEGINHLEEMIGLEGLILSGCNRLTSESTESLLGKLNLLKYLDLSFCPKISDTCLTKGLNISKDLHLSYTQELLIQVILIEFHLPP